MPKQIIEDELWKDRLSSADKYYKTWESKFKCNILEQYYEGFQWKGQYNGTLDANPYVINKVYETVQIKIDSYIPNFPKFLVSPQPGSSDFDLENASISAQLKQDVLNTIIANDHEVFTEEITQAYKDHFFRFGIIEVGYSADWILNPNVPKPLLNTDQKASEKGSKPYVAYAPIEVPQNERIYFKHVPAVNFRVGGMDHKYLHRCGWFGYCEYVDKNDLLALRGIKNRSKIESITGYSLDYSETSDQRERKGDYLKIWQIWDLRAWQRLIVVDSPTITIFERKLDRINVFDLRPDKSLITNGFYPIPPVWHWISPQNEINETREQLRNHRRRFNRKFQVIEGGIDDVELEKFEIGEDGALIKVKRENAISAISDAPLGVSLDKAIVTSGDDLNQISGTSSEVRGVADRTTATQANIITQRASIREKAERDRIARWLIRIGRETLLTVREKFVLGVWANLTSDNSETIFSEVQANANSLKWVTSEDLSDGFDFRIIVDITSMSAAAQEEEKRKFLEFNAVLTQFPHIAFSPKLIREAAYRCGYRNESVIKEMQTMALLQQLAMQRGLMQQQQGVGNAGQQIAAANTPNDMEQIRNQLTNQLGIT